MISHFGSYIFPSIINSCALLLSYSDFVSLGLLAFENKIQTHKRFKGTLIYYGTDTQSAIYYDTDTQSAIYYDTDRESANFLGTAWHFINQLFSPPLQVLIGSSP